MSNKPQPRKKKPDPIPWQESNLALFGSDEDKQVKKEAALEEKAWQIALNTEEPRLFVWRIEKFVVKPVDVQDYGQFYNGDSYIVLNIYLKNDALTYDVHFWIGRESTQDEYGTAAYKTVELDAALDDRAVQHREVEGFESELFRSYFPALRVLHGGVDSGFRKVTPNEYQPRLLHFQLQNKKNVVMKEVALSVNSLNSGDVFILDLGQQAYQWNGKECNKEERYAAAQFLQQLSSERFGKCKMHVLDEDSADGHEEFVNALPDVPITRTEADYEATKCLYRLSDESGELSFELISANSASKRMVDENDVYFLDAGRELFVYVGTQCSPAEKKNALAYAHNYLQHTTRQTIPISVVGGNQYSEALENAWDPDRSSAYLSG